MLLYTCLYLFLTLRCPSLPSSRRSHTLQWTCWGRVWAHCGVCLLCLPSHSDGSQSSPFSLLMHAPMPSGDSDSDSERKRTYSQKFKLNAKMARMQGVLPAAMKQHQFAFINAKPLAWVLRKSLVVICEHAGHVLGTRLQPTAGNTIDSLPHW